MGDPIFSKLLRRSSKTGAGTNAGVTVTVTGDTAGSGNRQHTPLGIQCSGDAAAVVTIESPSGTVLWRKRFAAAFAMSEQFTPGAIVGASAADLLVKVSASTSNSEANIQYGTIGS